MDQRIDMDRLYRAANTQCRCTVHIEQRAGCNDEQRAQSLAAADAGMAHRLEQWCALVIGNRQQRIEQPVDIAGNIA